MSASSAETHRRSPAVGGEIVSGLLVSHAHRVLTFWPKSDKFITPSIYLCHVAAAGACNTEFMVTIKNASDRRTIGSNSVRQKQGGGV